MKLRISIPLFGLISLAWLGCATLEQSAESERGTTYSEYRVIVDAPDVYSIQLHAGQNETSVPIVEMGSGLTLRLAFDLVESDSRPLNIYFYHADRDWKRDLSPSEVLTGFHYDDIQDYRSSGATVIPYVHYEYEFPNRSINFKVSGNYVLRVSEAGREDEVLFERKFYVTEQATSVEMRLDHVLMPGRQSTSIQPLVRFQPPVSNTNAFDYSVCIVRNAILDAPACIDSPTLDVQPDLAFVANREDSFNPISANYFIDVSELRTGGRIERVNQQPIPWRVEVEPDLARLPGTQLAPFLNGKSVIRASNRYINEPDYAAEYVNAVFRFVPPDGQPSPYKVFIVGSFSNWLELPDHEMRWDELNSWYEARVLLKQGHYEYFYATDDMRINRALSSGLPQLKSLFTSFVYYHDVFSQSDRLIASQSLMTE